MVFQRDSYEQVDVDPHNIFIYVKQLFPKMYLISPI